MLLNDSFLLYNLQDYLYSLSKYPNKEILSDCIDIKLPKEVYETEKTGFGIPIKEWMGINDNTNNQIFHTKWTNKISEMYEDKSLV